MESATHIALTMALTHGAAIAIGLRELWLLRRPGWRPDPEPPREPAPWPSGGGQPVPLAQRPLPDCLIPKRQRQLEDA